MTQTRFRYIEKPQENVEPARDQIFLQLARITLVVMLSTLGFLMDGYLSAINRTIEKISNTQEQMAVTFARVDQNVQNIDRRLNRLEDR